VGLEVNRDDVVLTSADGSMTWREIRRSTALAAGYSASASGGDRLASLMPNSALVVHYLACFKAGSATPLNYRYAARDRPRSR
jgi:acyl-CoA synthetase (AMP-forming)/AMP-acid ligase II